MGFCCRGRRRRRHGEAAEAATQRCEEAIGATGGPPRTPAPRPALETRTPLHSRACPSPLEVELGAAPSPSTDGPGPAPCHPAVRFEVELGATRIPTPCRHPAVRRVYALHAARRRPVTTVLDAARAAPSPAAAGAPPAPPSITPAARRTVDLDAAAAFAYTPPPPRARAPLAEANGASRGASAKRRPYRGLSTPALVADLERTRACGRATPPCRRRGAGTAAATRAGSSGTSRVRRRVGARERRRRGRTCGYKIIEHYKGPSTQGLSQYETIVRISASGRLRRPFPRAKSLIVSSWHWRACA